jgi:hypothetical protein
MSARLFLTAPETNAREPVSKVADPNVAGVHEPLRLLHRGGAAQVEGVPFLSRRSHNCRMGIAQGFVEIEDYFQRRKPLCGGLADHRVIMADGSRVAAQYGPAARLLR